MKFLPSNRLDIIFLLKIYDGPNDNILVKFDLIWIINI